MERLGADTWADRPRLPVRPGGPPGDGRPGAVCGSAGVVLRRHRAARRRPRPTPSPIADVLAEFRDRLAGGQMNAQHPRQFGYFTPPPLPVSMMGELLAQMTNQGVDVWHAGPLATFVEEEVVRWLCDLIGYEARSFGLLTSGGVMANFMGMALARDIHLGRLLGAGRAPRGAMLDGVRVYTSDQTHFSIARALDLLGFPPETLVVIPSDERFRLHGAPVAEAVARDRAAGLRAVRDRGGRRLDQHRLGRSGRRAGRCRGGGGPVAPRRRRVRRRRRGCRRAIATGCPTSSARIRSPSTRTSGSSRPTTSAGCWSATGRTWARCSAAARPSTTAAARRRPAGTADARRPRRPRRPAQLLQAQLRGHPPLARAQALDVLEASRHGRVRAASIEANDDLAALLARRCAESDDFEAIPATPELSVVCFRHLPGGATRRWRWRPRRSTPTRTALQAALEASGDGWLTTTRLRGATWLRAGIVNYLSTEADIDRLLATLAAPRPPRR